MAYDLYVLELLKRLNYVAITILPLFNSFLVFSPVDCFTDTGVWTLKYVPLSTIYELSVPQKLKYWGDS